MRTLLQLVIGLAVGAALTAATASLWARGLIVFAVPVGSLAAAALWVTVDNTLIYPRRRAALQQNAPEVSPPGTGE